MSKITIILLTILFPLLGYSQVNMGGKKSRKTNKKNGINQRMINKKKPPSLILAEEADKANKSTGSPKKDGKRAAKALKKKGDDSYKEREKVNKKVRKSRKVEKYKGPKKGKSKKKAEEG